MAYNVAGRSAGRGVSGLVEGFKIVLAPSQQLPIFETNLETLKRDTTNSDIIVIPDDELAMETKIFPVTRIIRPFREWLSANSQFRQVSEIGLRVGKIFIFENDHRRAAQNLRLSGSDSECFCEYKIHEVAARETGHPASLLDLGCGDGLSIYFSGGFFRKPNSMASTCPRNPSALPRRAI